MSISPVAGAIYANQVAPLTSSVQGSEQAKLDMQNALAAAAANEEEKRIEETRATEETYRIDPQNQHDKESNSGGEKEKKDDENKDENEGELLSGEELDAAIESFRVLDEDEEGQIFNFTV